MPTETFKSVAARDYYACGLRTDGVIFCWGSFMSTRTAHTVATRATGIFGIPPIKAQAVTTSDRHSCGLRTDNTITCWGWNRWGQSNPPTGTFKTVAAGGGYSCGLRTDNTIECWGRQLPTL